MMERLAVCFSITINLTTRQTLGYFGGSGTLEDPCQSGTAQDLIELGKNTDDYDTHFILNADIDLADRISNRAVIATLGMDSVGGSGDAYVCGLVGESNGSVLNSYSSGKVSGKHVVGGNHTSYH